MLDPERSRRQIQVDADYKQFVDLGINQFQLHEDNTQRRGELAKAILTSGLAPVEMIKLAEGAPEAAQWELNSMRRLAGQVN